MQRLPCECRTTAATVASAGRTQRVTCARKLRTKEAMEKIAKTDEQWREELSPDAVRGPAPARPPSRRSPASTPTRRPPASTAAPAAAPSSSAPTTKFDSGSRLAELHRAGRRRGGRAAHRHARTAWSAPRSSARAAAATSATSSTTARPTAAASASASTPARWTSRPVAAGPGRRGYRPAGGAGGRPAVAGGRPRQVGQRRGSGSARRLAAGATGSEGSQRAACRPPPAAAA